MIEVSLDDDGNELIFDGVFYKLKLVSEMNPRNVGEIKVSKEGTFMVSDRNFDKHFFKKTYSWGFSRKLVEVFMESFPSGHLGIKSDVGSFSIKATDAVEQGDYKHFKKIGFELQLMVHHSCFKKWNISDRFNKFVATEVNNETRTRIGN